jgi:hypothetical protein
MQLISDAIERFGLGWLSDIVYEVVSEIFLFFRLIQKWDIWCVVKSVKLLSDSFVLELYLTSSSRFFVLNETVAKNILKL